MATRSPSQYEGRPAIIKAGGDADLVINTPDVIDELVNEGKIAGPRTDLFIPGVGLAVKQGASKPDISSDDALRKTLQNAKSVAYSRGQSGVDFLVILDRLGIAPQMKSKLKVYESPVGAAAVVAKGDAQLAVQNITDLLSESRVDVVVGPLPDDLPQSKIVYSAGIPRSARHREAANALLNFLKSPDAADAIKAKGLQPALFN